MMDKVPLRPRYAVMNGIMYPEMFSPKCFREAQEYEPQAGDVFIDTYPKCGTTWMQNVALYIFRKGREFDNSPEFFKLAPFIDMVGREGIDAMPRPGAFKTHLPYPHMPYSRDAKYIFVARNPKDCCVSFYYHAKNQPGFGYWDARFDDFFELFMAGEVEYNDYFDHLLGWYPHRNDGNVFHTTYEDMKRDMTGVVLKLSRFLGEEFATAIEKDNAVLRNILHFTSFDYMKRKLAEAYAVRRDSDGDIGVSYTGLKHFQEFVKSLDPPKDIPLEFVRKGIVGDWKNHLSVEQNERLNKKFVDKLKGTDVMQWYPLE